MSLLRITGILCSLIPLIMVFFRLRTQSENRTDVWLLAAFGLGLLLVSLFPGLVNLPAEVLSLKQHERGRILTLLLLSSGLLWLLLIYERSKGKTLRQQFDQYQRLSLIKNMEKQIESARNNFDILVLIPVFNEAENLGRLLRKIPDTIAGRRVLTLIINDGSSDETAQVARDYKVLVADHLVNKGGGSALKTGYELAHVLHTQYIVTMDGDGQHDPKEIERLLDPVINDTADLIIGSRILGSSHDSSKLRLLGVVLFGKLMSFLLGKKVTDCSSGFRAFHQKILAQCDFFQEQYHTAELLIETVKRGFRVAEVPATIHQRQSGESKKGTNWKYGTMFFKTIIKTWFR